MTGARSLKRITITLSLITLILSLCCLPMMPWSAQSYHLVEKSLARATTGISDWQGIRPRNISLTGKIIDEKGALKGAQIEIIDSISGWASQTDYAGRFQLPYAQWLPRGSVALMVRLNNYQQKRLVMAMPATYPETGSIDLGELSLDNGENIGAQIPGENSFSYIKFDLSNRAFYRSQFNLLTINRQTDAEKVAAIAEFVAGKLLTGEFDERRDAAKYFTSAPPREILSRGSYYCGNLALLMATILAAGNYQTRLVDLIDSSAIHSHVMVEVYYRERWHLYDPATGQPMAIKAQRVLSFKEIRLSGLESMITMPEHLPKIPSTWFTEACQRGFYHYYYFSG